MAASAANRLDNTIEPVSEDGSKDLAAVVVAQSARFAEHFQRSFFDLAVTLLQEHQQVHWILLKDLGFFAQQSHQL